MELLICIHRTRISGVPEMRSSISLLAACRLVATKEDQTVRSARQSLLIAAAKARVWATSVIRKN
jgi:hypothetical protein